MQLMVASEAKASLTSCMQYDTLKPLSDSTSMSMMTASGCCVKSCFSVTYSARPPRLHTLMMGSTSCSAMWATCNVVVADCGQVPVHEDASVGDMLSYLTCEWSPVALSSC